MMSAWSTFVYGGNERFSGSYSRANSVLGGHVAVGVKPEGLIIGWQNERAVMTLGIQVQIVGAQDHD